MIPGVKIEKMSEIKKDELNKNENEENKSSRRKEKYQTYLVPKPSLFKSTGKDKRTTILLKDMHVKFKSKKHVFGNKKSEQLFFKKLRESMKLVSVFDILGLREKNKKNYDNISHEIKKYEQKLGNVLSYENRTSLKDEPPEDIESILGILSLQTEKRTFNDVFLLKKYLLKTKIEWLFKDEFENKEESIEKLLTFFALEMNYRLFKEGEEVFKVGDPSVYLFLIIKGKIEILKPTPEIRLISGHEYFSYIMNLKHSKEDHLLNINLEENFKQFDIDKNEMELLPAIYILHVFELIKMKKKINFEEELALVNMTLNDLELNQKTVHSYEHLSSKIEEKLPFVPPFLLNKYKFIVDKKNKKEVKLIKYTRVLILGNNEFFGESAMGQNEKRNATIKVLEDSYLGYLSANLYKTNFFNEKKLAMQNKINFLNNRFFFKNINIKRFEKKYFNLFVYEKYLNGNILFKENEMLNYVYFIEDGLVELTSTKTMLEIEIFLRGLEENFSLKGKENNLEYKAIKSRTKDLEDYLNKTQQSKILIVGRNESLGIESFFYGIPYFATAKVVSQRAKIFKISIEQLWQILNIEKDCILSLKKLVLHKIKILQERLFSMNNTKLVLLDNKIIFNYEFDFNNTYRNKKQEENKTEKKNVLTYREIKIDNISLLKRNNYLSSTPTNMLSETHNNKNKTVHFNQKNSINNTKKAKTSLINSMRNFKENKKIQYRKKPAKKLIIPSFEDRWINNAKNEIKILNNDKQFMSHINFDDNRHNNEKENDNYEKKEFEVRKIVKVENRKFGGNLLNDNNFENNKQESIIIDKKNNLILDNMVLSPKLSKFNNSLDSILPSILNSKNSEKGNKNSSNIKKYGYNNYSYSFNISNKDNLIKTSLSSFNRSKKIFDTFMNISNKDRTKNNYIKLTNKKFNNFYEIKNDYNKKKFRFYNDREIFGFNKEKNNKNIEITNFKVPRNKSSDSLFLKYSNNKLRMNNEDIIFKINGHS